MSSVYRIRPCNDLTIDEIENHYLWFSRRCGFNDSNDANIGAFLDNNMVLREAFERILTPEGIKYFRKIMECTGICCFTNKKPTNKKRHCFPSGNNCICIEYNREILENHFISKYSLADCFCEVQYFDSPILFEKDGESHILTKKDKDGRLYESVKELVRLEKNREKLIKLLLTRINSKHRIQNEQRIILGGKNIPSFASDVSGYRVQIPKDAISNIYIFQNTDEGFIKKLSDKGIEFIK